MANEPFTTFSQIYNRNDLDRGSFTDCGDGTSARQTILCNTKELADDIAQSLEEGAGEVILLYSEIVSLASLATATVLSYTVPVGKKFFLNRIDFNGCNMANYTTKDDASILSKYSTYYTKFNGSSVFNSYEMAAGQVLTLEVFNRGLSSGDFNSTLQGRLLDA